MLRVPAMTILLSGALLLTGCGSEDKTGTPAASSTPAPESRTTTAAAVATGLQQITKIAADISTSISDKAKVTTLDEGIEPVWSTIEGTVKANDSDTYIALEDAFAVLGDAVKAADATKAKAGSDAVAKAVSAYLAKYPA